MRRAMGIMGAVITCPCHLPIWIALLGGTAAGAELSERLAPVLLVASVLFAAFVLLSLAAGSEREGHRSEGRRLRDGSLRR